MSPVMPTAPASVQGVRLMSQRAFVGPLDFYRGVRNAKQDPPNYKLKIMASMQVTKAAIMD